MPFVSDPYFLLASRLIFSRETILEEDRATEHMGFRVYLDTTRDMALALASVLALALALASVLALVWAFDRDFDRDFDEDRD